MSTATSHAHATRKVNVQFSSSVTKEQIFGAVEHVLRVTGCMTCGIRGIDLQLAQGDPSFDELKGLPGVEGVHTSV